MSVEFNDGQDTRRNDFDGSRSQSKIALWLLARGLAKDEAAANKIQITAAVIFFALALFFILK